MITSYRYGLVNIVAVNDILTNRCLLMNDDHPSRNPT